jgi:transposase
MKTLHRRCAGLDVHKKEVVACLRLVIRGKASYEARRFPRTTRGLIELADWLEQAGCTHVAMEATGVYWKPVCAGRAGSNRSWPTRRTSREYPGARAT